MSYNWDTRTELLFGTEHMERLSRSHVLVVGLGGMGVYIAEQIYRTGIGEMTIIDADTVNESNINRQLSALHSALGMPRAKVVTKRLLDINPQLQLTVLNEFLRDEWTEKVPLSAPLDFAVDAIDSLSPEVYLVCQAYTHKIPTVSSMEAGAKVDSFLIRIADISKIINRALVKVVWKQSRPLGVSKRIPVISSTELADPDAVIEAENKTHKRTTTGTVSYVSATFGCFLALHVLRNLI